MIDGKPYTYFFFMTYLLFCFFLYCVLKYHSKNMKYVIAKAL